VIARTFHVFVAAVAVWQLSTLYAQPSHAPRLERPVLTAGAGPQRLPIDVALLTKAAPFDTVRSVGASDVPRWRAEGGLDDLRLFAAEGGERREIGYLLVYPDAIEAPWLNGAILPIASTETETRKTSGFEADLGPAQTVDMIRVEGLPAPLLKRFVLEGSGDREHWTLLEGEGTFFDLPVERLRQVALSFRPGVYRYVRVTWDDTHSGRVPLPRAVLARRAAGSAAPPPLTTEVGFERRSSEPGRSRFHIRLPRARLPIVALSLDVGGGHVFRTVTVSESKLIGAEVVPAQIGRGTIARVTRSGATATQLRIPIVPPREPELDLVVDDGNNPPLDLKRVVADFAEMPWIYFEAPASAVVARYGDPRAASPSYDLEAARPSVSISNVPVATWGEPRELTAPAAPLPAAPMPDTGAEIDAEGFRFRRPLPEGPAGLAALGLDAAILAHSRGPSQRFADVRIIDAGGRQVPYIIERREEPLTIELQLEPFTPNAEALRSGNGRQRSVYKLRLPYQGLPSPRLVLETSARVFQRSVQVGVERPPDRNRRETWFDVKAASVWSHADDATAPRPLTVTVGGDDTDLIVMVDEGDNRALPITAARVLLPSYRLRFYRPPGALRVAYGRDNLTVPQYDLALLAPQVMGAEAREITAAPPDAAPAPPGAQLLSPSVFWIGLGAAVLVLLAIIARLVRS
jgi:Protein of unknown function (DUF3999)